MKSKLLVLSTALMLVLAGCSGNNNQSFTPASSGSQSGSESQSQTAVTGVSLNQTSLNMVVGETQNLVATVMPDSATNKNITWTATGDGVVSVDDGVVTALKGGDSTVTATTVDGGFTASCNINVTNLEKPDLFYCDGTFDYSDYEIPGKVTYWAGDGGSVSSHTYNFSTKQFSLAFTTCAWEQPRFYSVQIYYLLPYAEAEDRYDITWVINSTAAGRITVNGSAKDIVVGENTIELNNAALSNGRNLNVQMGVDGGEQQFKSGATFTFAAPVIKDRSSTAYYRTTFTNNDTLLKDIQVKSGKLVNAPADPVAPAGKVFVGWYDGETRFDNTQPVTASHNYTAKIVDEGDVTKYDVKVYDGSTLLDTIQVVGGTKVNLSSVPFPFGYAAKAFYKDSGLTEVFDPAVEIITAPINIYAKKQIKQTAIYNHDDDHRFDNLTNLEDGSLQIQFQGRGAGADAWKDQVNFVLPAGTHNYQVSFTYSINRAGGQVEIYDNATKAGPNALAVGNNQNGSLNYNGVLSAQNKLTFELGNMPAGQDVTFILHSITLTY